MNKVKQVKLPAEVDARLEQLRNLLGLRSKGEAAKLLLDFIDNPLTILALGLEIRDDIKKLLISLDKLNSNIERLLEAFEKLTKR